MFDSYPQLNPVSLLKQLIYYPIRLLFAAIVEVHLWLFREKTLRIAILYNYPKRGHAKLLKFLIQKVASQRIGNIFSGMSQLELRKYISHVSWADEDGTFGHFEQYAKSEYGRHEDPESIKKEKLGSVIKHNFPVFFVFEYLLKNIESIVEYGSGDCRNYSYTKGNIAGGGGITALT